MEMFFLSSLLTLALLGHIPTRAQVFRELKWGISPTEVIQNEGQPERKQFYKKELDFYYHRSVAGISDVATAFGFEKNKLHFGRYTFTKLDKAQRIAIFSSLREKYGQPVRSKMINGSGIYHWTKNDTRIVFSKGKLNAYVLSYYPNSPFSAERQSTKKEKFDGL